MPNEEPKQAIEASLRMLNIGKLKVTLPIWAAMFLAPLSSILKPNFTLWYEGISGSFKSVLGALALCHFGEFTYLTLPASWRDTANQLEKFQAILKDMPLYIDDWAPGTDSGKQRELENKAEHIIRGQGNLQGKARMKADTSSRTSYTPRGLTISSGEQLPSGYSQSARMIVVEINRDEIDTHKLTQAQNEAGQYSMAMSHYINWVIKRYDNLTFELNNAFNDTRDKILNTDCHSRLPGPITMLYLGLDLGLMFAMEKGAVNEKEAEKLRNTGWNILIALGKGQSDKVNLERPSVKFIKGLKAILDAETGVLASRNVFQEIKLKPNQSLIGWQDSEHMFLQPENVYKAVAEFYQRSGKPLLINADAIWKDLKLQHISVVKEEDRRTYAARIPALGPDVTKNTIKISNSVVNGEGEQSDDE